MIIYAYVCNVMSLREPYASDENDTSVTFARIHMVIWINGLNVLHPQKFIFKKRLKNHQHEPFKCQRFLNNKYFNKLLNKEVMVKDSYSLIRRSCNYHLVGKSLSLLSMSEAISSYRYLNGVIIRPL